MICGIGHRCGSDPLLLWFLHRLAATALIRPLAWEPPYAVGVALEKYKKTKKFSDIIFIAVATLVSGQPCFVDIFLPVPAFGFERAL